MDRPVAPKDPCPLNNSECPVLGELRRLKEECARLEEQSRIDVLTGFCNFRHLLEALGDEMERTRRTGLSTGLIMIDLDRFKRVNDTYGHESGNKALRWASSVIRGAIRRIDIPCRTRLPQAVLTAERLRAALAESRLKLDAGEVRLTASFGVDSYRGRSDLSVDAFIKRTDRFLLQAKADGRNCVRYDEFKAAVAPTEVTDQEREALLRNNESEE